jgi:hypothetical protein
MLGNPSMAATPLFHVEKLDSRRELRDTHSVLEKPKPTSGPQTAGSPQIHAYFICSCFINDAISVSKYLSLTGRVVNR